MSMVDFAALHSYLKLETKIHQSLGVKHPMKVAVFGSREFRNEAMVRSYVRHLPRGAEVVSGGARGVDSWAQDEAEKRVGSLRFTPFLVDKGKLPPYGSTGSKQAYRKAAFERTEKALDYADALVSFWDGKSNGTKHGIDYATSKKMPWAAVIQQENDEDYVVRCGVATTPGDLFIVRRQGH